MTQFLLSIRKLKNRLSHYLRLIRTDESVVVTNRGVPVGQALDQRLAAMRETGLAQWSGHRLRHRKPVARLRGRKTVAQLLVEGRR